MIKIDLLTVQKGVNIFNCRNSVVMREKQYFFIITKKAIIVFSMIA